MKTTKLKRVFALLLITSLLLALLPPLPVSAEKAKWVGLVTNNNGVQRLDGNYPYLEKDKAVFYYDGYVPLDGTNCTAHFESSTGTLRLNNFKGKRIFFESSPSTADKDLIIELIGDNQLELLMNEDNIYEDGCIDSRSSNNQDKVNSVTLTSTQAGRLTINAKNLNGSAFGIRGTRTNTLTVSGNANVTIKASSAHEGSSKAYGIKTGNVVVKDNASLSVTAEATSERDSAASYCIDTGAMGSITFNTSGEINLEHKRLSNNNHHGIFYAKTFNLTKVGTLTMKYRWDVTPYAPARSAWTWNENNFPNTKSTASGGVTTESYRYSVGGNKLSGKLTISGTPNVGQTLTAVVTNSNSYGPFTYQWKLEGSNISGATNSTYVPVASNLNKILTCEVRDSNKLGALADSVQIVAPTPGALTGSVTISGKATFYETLTAKVTGANSTALKYQWKSDGANISGATANSFYVNNAGYVNKTITCVVTATDKSGSLTSPGVKLGKRDLDAPTFIVGVNPTAAGSKDGKLTGIDEEMEYATKADFSDAKWAGDYQDVTGLSAGTYYIRYPGTWISNPSPAQVVVLTDPPSQKYAVTVHGGLGGGNYTEGATVNITAGAAPAGKMFDKWTTTDGVSFAGANAQSTSFTMPAKAVAVTANYKDLPANTFAVNVQSDGGGTASASATAAKAGTEITLTYTPQAGWRFKEWQTVSGGVTVKSNKFTMPSGAVTVKAVFEKIPVYAVTVNGGMGSGDYQVGDTVSIMAGTAPEGKAFDKWNAPGVTLAFPGNQITSFVMPAKAVALTAVYKDLPKGTFAVNVLNNGGGTASASETAAESGAKVTLTAIADSGYRFKEWQPVSGGAEIKNGVFTMPSETVTVRAIFEPIPEDAPVYTVTEGADGNWKKGSPSGARIVCDGDFAKFTGIKMDGAALDAEHYTAVSGSTDVTLTAKYLETLEPGLHTVEFVYEDGSAATKLTILAKDDEAEPTHPIDGPDGAPKNWLWLIILPVAAALLAGGIFFAVRHKKKRPAAK